MNKSASRRLEQVLIWYKKAHIDYSRQFLCLYISYNAWFREVTGTTNDREAIAALKKRFIIWDDYCNDRIMRTLPTYMQQLVDLTQKEPLPTTTQYWDGEIDTIKDWRSLIEYWYQVRCRIVHGMEVEPVYSWLAYETLAVFMEEIVTRIQRNLATPDVWSVDMQRAEDCAL